MSILKIFLRKGIGKKLPFLSKAYYKIISPLLVNLLNPIKIWRGGILYLPHNGIDYIPEVYEPEVIKLLETTLKKGDIFLDIGGGNRIFLNYCLEVSRRNG